MRHAFTAVVGLLSIFGPSQMHALGGSITTLYSTGEGLAASGSPHHPQNVIDPHYTIVSAPTGVIPSGSTSADAYTTPAGSKNAPPAIDTEWIAPNPGNSFTEPEGNYDYQTQFSLTGFIASTAMIKGEFAADNSLVEVLLNGVVVPGISGGGLESLTGFVIDTGFKSGVNTLDFIVHNDATTPNNNNPTGLLVVMSGTATVAVPEPCSLVIAAIGCAAIGCFHRSRRGHQLTRE